MDAPLPLAIENDRIARSLERLVPQEIQAIKDCLVHSFYAYCKLMLGNHFDKMAVGIRRQE